jgi:GR25 family glycosyltransferase involved in LPS biosynthesis
MSHISIWEKIKDSENAYLILEDDVIIPPTLNSTMDQVVLDCPFDWDILFLGYAGKLKGVKKGNYLIASSGNLPDTNHGMFAYVINPKSVKKIINICKPIRKIKHIDWILREKYSTSPNKNKISAVYFVPNLIKHNNKIKSQNR